MQTLDHNYVELKGLCRRLCSFRVCGGPGGGVGGCFLRRVLSHGLPVGQYSLSKIKEKRVHIYMQTVQRSNGGKHGVMKKLPGFAILNY